MSAAAPEPPESSIDAFHRGAFFLAQPAGRGHRAGLDAMILAAAVPSGFSGRLADLGAGAGAAGLAVASRCPHARVVLVERDPEMLDYARRSRALPGNAALRERTEVLDADVTLAGEARAAAGLADRAFDCAIMNPPFNAPADHTTSDELRKSAHVMPPETFEQWIRTAAAIVKPGGALALIARPGSLQPILAALAGRFGEARIVPVHPRAEEEAIRIVLRARKGSRGGLSLRPPLVLHEAEHIFTQRADAICNGKASLFGD
ncbi:MAG: methyltransferase [Rhizobiales bacterium 65-79]|jgi:tRNA1(Val) A37 N6-methylase TrmN6|nr:methyltransferase [Hyphomicrobiales bacterium]OJU02015.1 MAG: methyltransferase [Rhizobiales bacterium 65-79]